MKEWEVKKASGGIMNGDEEMLTSERDEKWNERTMEVAAKTQLA